MTNGQKVTMPPLLPPRPRITSGGDCWILDTGHVDVLFDKWQEAIAHAERICRDYRARLLEWAVPSCEPFCNFCAGPYDGWLAEQYGGHWDTCMNRTRKAD